MRKRKRSRLITPRMLRHAVEALVSTRRDWARMVDEALLIGASSQQLEELLNIARAKRDAGRRRKSDKAMSQNGKDAEVQHGV